jgi:hypothetical protein
MNAARPLFEKRLQLAIENIVLTGGKDVPQHQRILCDIVELVAGTEPSRDEVLEEVRCIGHSRRRFARN